MFHSHKTVPDTDPKTGDGGKRPVSIYKSITFMKFARYFGAFPLQYVDNDEEECLQFYPKSWFIVVAVMALASFLYFAEVFVLRMNGLYGWTLSDEMKQQGLKSTDTVAMVLLWIPHIAAFFVNFGTLRRAGPAFSGLSRKVAALPNMELTEGMKVLLPELFVHLPDGTTTGDDDHDDASFKRHFIDTGLYITELIQMTERTLGTLLYVSFGVSFSTEVFGGFFGIMMITAFSGGGFNLLEFIFGLFFALLGVLHMTLFIAQTIMISQTMTNQMKKAKRLLEVIVYKKVVKLDESERDSLSILIKRLSKQAAIRPLDAFDVGRAMSLSVYGLLATYIIVLLQFKLGECPR